MLQRNSKYITSYLQCRTVLQPALISQQTNAFHSVT